MPVYAARKVAPAVHGAASANFMAFLWIAPTATLAAFVFGAAEQTGFAFFALYGLRSGLAEFQSALLLTMVAVGNLVLQIPLGLLADRFDRTRLLLVCGIVGAAGMLALPYAVHTPWQAYALLLVWGGITGGFYTIGLTQLGSRFNGADLASANAMFVMLYSIGMMLGPFGAGMAMDHIGTNALTWLLAALFAAHAMIAGARVLALSR